MQLCPENISWFSYQICRDDLPEWFEAEDLASVICALEALVQFVLCFFVRPRGRARVTPCGVFGSHDSAVALRQSRCGWRYCTRLIHDAAIMQCTTSYSQALPGIEQSVALQISHVLAATCSRIFGKGCSRTAVMRWLGDSCAGRPSAQATRRV